VPPKEGATGKPLEQNGSRPEQAFGVNVCTRLRRILHRPVHAAIPESVADDSAGGPQAVFAGARGREKSLTLVHSDGDHPRFRLRDDG